MSSVAPNRQKTRTIKFQQCYLNFCHMRLVLEEITRPRETTVLMIFLLLDNQTSHSSPLHITPNSLHLKLSQHSFHPYVVAHAHLLSHKEVSYARLKRTIGCEGIKNVCRIKSIIFITSHRRLQVVLVTRILCQPN